jgi:hypothetical protein
VQQSFIAGGVPVVATELGNGVTGTIAVRVERSFVMQMFAPPSTRDLLLGGVEVDAWVTRGMPTTRTHGRWAVCGLDVSMSSRGLTYVGWCSKSRMDPWGAPIKFGRVASGASNRGGSGGGRCSAGIFVVSVVVLA